MYPWTLHLKRLVILCLWGCSCVQASTSDYIKAVTYFGESWPIAFWNSSFDGLADDFRVVREDGFNAVILVVPWGEFQPGIQPVRFNEDAYRRLEHVCRTAKAQRLRVFFRVSYTWDFYPNVQLPHAERAMALLADDTLMPAWQSYLRRIGQATRECGEGYFISWEDHWSPVEAMSHNLPANRSAELSKRFGLDAWLRQHADAGFVQRHADEIKRWGSYLVPARKTEDFRWVYRWFDDQLKSRLMPALTSALPQATMEVRIDDDPVYQGDKLLQWFSHKATYGVGSAPHVMTYWSPAMGGVNQGERISAQLGLERFAAMQRKLKNDSSKEIFIHQFLFKDNTPSAASNAKMSDADIDEFLNQAAQPLRSLTRGYALWGARDYTASMLFNGFFSLGFMGWWTDPSLRVVKRGQRHWVRLSPPGVLSQQIPVQRCHYCPWASSTQLRLLAKGPGVLDVNFAGKTHSFELGKAVQTLEMRFPTMTDAVPLSLASKKGQVEVTKLQLYNFVQTGDVRSTEGAPGPHLSAVRRLNERLERSSLP